MNTLTLALLTLLTSLSAAAAGAAESGKPRTWLDPKTGIEFIRVDKACYRMGNNQHVAPEADGAWVRLNYSESLSSDEKPEHEVCLDAYWLGRHEVTRKQWLKVMSSLPDDDVAGSEDIPVTHVTWEHANTFAERLSALHGKRYRFRLPTEAEWEFACRGAKAGALDREVATTSDELAQFALADVQAPASAGAVGSRKANSAGFFDLLGNVWEWTADDYAAEAYARHGLYNPRRSGGGDTAVIRGGSVRTELVQARCTMRGRYPKQDTLSLIGLRVVRED